MHRFTALLITVVFTTTVVFAQEQVLKSTPIYATYEAESEPQLRTAQEEETSKISSNTDFTTAATSNYAVGTTPSSSAVSPTGAFTYNVPIAVPPGVQDVQPNIALTYSSQAGNGLAGWGWNISGLSSISRVGSTLHHDGIVDPIDFDGLDRFALDGQRLIVTSGTYGKPGAVYTTENYSNIKITSRFEHPRGSHIGPRTFIVHYPDGSRAYYGYYSMSSNIYNISTVASISEWVITSWIDAQGNQVKYSYDFADGKSAPLRIRKILYGSVDYTPGSFKYSISSEVVFNYKNRERYEVSYVGGSQTRKNILSSIEVKHKDKLYRKYHLTHHTTSIGYQRVSQIQETNGEGEQKAPVVFTYDSNLRSSSISSSNMNTPIEPGLVINATKVLSGNFNRDANLDFISYDKNKKNVLNIFTGAFNNSITEKTKEIARSVAVSAFEELFTASVLNDKGGVDAFQRVVSVGGGFTGSFQDIKFNVFGEMPNDPTDEITIDYTKQWKAPIAQDFLCNSIPNYGRIPGPVEPLRIVKRAIPKTYITGDFTGNGLTDVIAINKQYSEKTCDPPTKNCQERMPWSTSTTSTTSRTKTTTSQRAESTNCHCECTNRTVGGGRLTLIDLDRTKTTNFTSYAGTIPNYKSSDRLFAADFNGDGKSDIWYITDKNIKIFSLVNNQFIKIAEHTNDDLVRTYLHILPGDYNGDGTTDLLIPKEFGSDEWYIYYSNGRNFTKKTIELFKYFISIGSEDNPHSQIVYIPQDLNQDGKTDLLKHELSYINYRPGVDFENLYRESLDIYLNSGSNSFTKSAHFQNKDYDDYNDPTRIIKHVTPVITGVETQNKKMQYAVLSRNLIKRYNISTPHRSNMRLKAVTKSGVRSQIDYAGLDAAENSSVYQADYGLKYPYVNINHAPGMELVSKLTQTANGYTSYQQFKYKGAVSHANGLGFLGFTGLARSNLYGANVAPLWTVSKQDPKLRGATTEQWTDTSYSFNPNCYINKTVTGYHTELRPNKVYVSVPEHMATHNNLTGVLHERFFTYDSFFNLETEREKTEGLDKTTTYNYYNNNTTNDGFSFNGPTESNYHIGRLRWEKTVAKVPGATDFWTEKSYTFENNLLKTEKVRANGSNWVSTTYNYDSFGNTTSKTLAAPGYSNRTESFTYYPNGRDLKTHTDVLGLVTSYEYYPYGALKKETDPYGNSTQYTYDGWNRLKTTTNYLGRTTTVNYTHRYGGGFVKTINHPNTAPDTKTYYNAFGWIDEVHTQVSDRNWSKTYYKYDILGRTVQESVPDFTRARKWNKTYYDLYGRIAQLEQANGKVIETVYDGLRTQVDDGTKTATTTKNALDQIVELADTGGTIRYSYHGNGELREADYGGYVVKTELDKWGRKNKLIDPTAGTFTYKHNDLGELQEETAPKGKTVYKHDSKGRLETKTWTGDLTNMVTSYGYNKTTQLLDYENTSDAINGTTQRITYSYDDYKRIKKLHEAGTHANFSKDIRYDYYGRVYSEVFNATDNLSKETYNTNVFYNYDTTGNVDRLSNQMYSRNELWKAKERNALGQLTRSETGNGFEKTRTIDAFGFITDVRDQKGYNNNQKALDLHYNFDVARGLLLSRSDALLDIQNQRFEYDDMDRLTAALRDTKGRTRSRTRGYDPRGRLTQDSFMGVNLSYGSGNDRYKLIGAELNPVGNAYYNTHKERNITYNADRKPVEVHDVGNGRITFNYSHDGQRQEVWYGGEESDKTKRNYHKTYSRIAPMEIVRDTETDNIKFLTYIGGDAYTAPVVHVRDTNANNPNGHHYLHRDYLGSILAVSNCTGNVIERAHFGAWGDEVLITTGENATTARSDSLTGRGFTGHEHFTEVGLVHMNGRMYDPMQGRFLSPDNHIQDPFNTQNFNRFGYVLNNPLTLTDPSGEFFWVAVALGAWFGGATAMMQGGDIWDILGGMLIGGLAGGLSAGLSNLAAQGLGLASAGATLGFFGNAALTISGFGAGFTVGFVGGFAGGFVGAAGNAMLKGQKFGKSLLMGLKAGFFSGVAAGVTGGVAAGLKARKAGGDFWTGKGATFETLAPPGTPTEVAQDLEYSNEFARDFSDKYIGEVKGLNELYANGSFPEGYSTQGMRVFNSKGQEILGVTKSLGNGQSNVYLAQKAFSSKEVLYLTLKHEYIHVELINAGFSISQFGKSHHASIYKWEYEQAFEWGMKSFNYLERAIRYESYYNSAVDRFMPNILSSKPW